MVSGTMHLVSPVADDNTPTELVDALEAMRLGAELPDVTRRRLQSRDLVDPFGITARGLAILDTRDRTRSRLELPDVPIERGNVHLRTLAQLVEGLRAIEGGAPCSR